MNISNMHIWFRQFAQQMGLQNVRGILSEQIDIVLNAAINDISNKIIKENLITTGKGNDNNSKLSNINVFRKLYRTSEYDLTSNEYFHFDREDSQVGKLTSTSLLQRELNNMFKIATASLNYKVTKNGFTGVSTYNPLQFASDAKTTKQYKVRFIDGTLLEDTLNDYHTKSKLYSPIINITNDDCVELYIDSLVKNYNNYYTFKDSLVPYKFKVNYIKKPAVVKLDNIDPANNVDCDLHESVHIDIIKYACDLYKIAVGNGLYTTSNNNNNKN